MGKGKTGPEKLKSSPTALEEDSCRKCYGKEITGRKLGDANLSAKKTYKVGKKESTKYSLGLRGKQKPRPYLAKKIVTTIHREKTRDHGHQKRRKGMKRRRRMRILSITPPLRLENAMQIPWLPKKN